MVSYETVRAWAARFGPAIARGLRARRPGSSGHWHLDEVLIPSAKSGGLPRAAKRVIRNPGDRLLGPEESGAQQAGVGWQAVVY